MKKLMIMRHAKSDWENNLRDFDRPLNKRGKKAAAFMGKEIKKRNLIPDMIISSPAQRAKETANFVVESSKFGKEIIWNDGFYFGYTNEIIETLKNTPENINSVLIFGHNPTWSELVNYFSGEYIEMVTASLAVLNFDSKKWSDLAENSCSLTEFLKPKDLM